MRDAAGTETNAEARVLAALRGPGARSAKRNAADAPAASDPEVAPTAGENILASDLSAEHAQKAHRAHKVARRSRKQVRILHSIQAPVQLLWQL